MNVVDVFAMRPFDELSMAECAMWTLNLTIGELRNLAPARC